MTKVLFVGDSPAKGNLRVDIPFVGAKCFKTLIKWIKELEPDYYICLNSNSGIDMIKILSLYNQGGFNVIALGNKASCRLTYHNIKHFQLPHPSGLNRKLNNTKALQLVLNQCKRYIEEK